MANSEGFVTATGPELFREPRMRRTSLPLASSTRSWMLAVVTLPAIGVSNRVRPAISFAASDSGTPTVSVASRRSASRAASTCATDWFASRLLWRSLASNSAAAPDHTHEDQQHRKRQDDLVTNGKPHGADSMIWRLPFEDRCGDPTRCRIGPFGPSQSAG